MTNSTLHGMALVDAIREERAEAPAGISTLGLDRTHRWITHMKPGHVQMTWTVEPRYFNLESAVICSWIAALGDQAIFFAGTSVCGDGEGTRMAEFSVSLLENMSGGEAVITAHVDRRVGDRIWATCTFESDAGELAARMTAVLDVIHD